MYIPVMYSQPNVQNFVHVYMTINTEVLNYMAIKISNKYFYPEIFSDFFKLVILLKEIKVIIYIKGNIIAFE